ncbi:MAG: CBS domain-containing protein [Pyrodictiaceae archaeon]
MGGILTRYEAYLRLGFGVVDTSASIKEAIRSMYLEGVEYLAIVDEEERLVGIVSVRDIARRIMEFFEESSIVEFPGFKLVLSEPLTSIARKPEIVLSEESSFKEALRIIVEKGVGFVPIVRGGKLRGGYTELHAALLLLGSSKPALEYATPNPVWGDSSQPLIEALGFMLSKGFRRIPLSRDGEIYLASMHKLLYVMAKARSVEGLIANVVEAAASAIVLEEPSLSLVAETILAVPERAVLLREKGTGKIYIMTESDLARAAQDAIEDGEASWSIVL